MPRSIAYKSFKLGDRIVLTHMEDNDYLPAAWKGYTATVKALLHDDVYITWDHDPHEARTPSAWRWELCQDAIDLSRIASSRAGYPVSNVQECESGLQAHVSVNGTDMCFHYGRDGRFMPGKDNPVDLVEAK